LGWRSPTDTVAAWLESHGLHVNVVYPSGMLIDFSGTAAQVRKAFQTEIHYLNVRGEKHVGNIRRSARSRRFAPVVAGIVSLHTSVLMRCTICISPQTEFTFTDAFEIPTMQSSPRTWPQFNLNPLFSAGISGQGQTIVLIEDTDVFSASDWTTFRSTLVFPAYTSATFSQVHPRLRPDPITAVLLAPLLPMTPKPSRRRMGQRVRARSGHRNGRLCRHQHHVRGLIAMQNLINGSTPPPPSSVSVTASAKP